MEDGGNSNTNMNDEVSTQPDQLPTKDNGNNNDEGNTSTNLDNMEINDELTEDPFEE